MKESLLEIYRQYYYACNSCDEWNVVDGRELEELPNVYKCCKCKTECKVVDRHHYVNWKKPVKFTTKKCADNFLPKPLATNIFIKDKGVR